MPEFLSALNHLIDTHEQVTLEEIGKVLVEEGNKILLLFDEEDRGVAPGKTYTSVS